MNAVDDNPQITRLYCFKSEARSYHHFYPRPRSVAMCGCGVRDPPIVFVELSTNVDGAYWAWWDIVERRHKYVYAVRAATEICFPYGFEVEEARGKGKLVRVSVKELGT